MKRTRSHGDPRTTGRVLGIATTSHGFAFAVIEGSKRLVDWGQRDVQSGQPLEIALSRVMARSRPMLVACESVRRAHRTLRGAEFIELVGALCRESGSALVSVGRSTRCADNRPPTTVTNQMIAEDVARRFPQLARVLPRRRRLWDGVDDRIGVFLAASAALSALREVGDGASDAMER